MEPQINDLMTFNSAGDHTQEEYPPQFENLLFNFSFIYVQFGLGLGLSGYN